MGAPDPTSAAPSAAPADRRLKAIACEVFHRELCRLAAESERTVDLEFVPKGLHDLPAGEMRARLQARVDAVDPERYAAVALAYGLCNNGLAGLRAGATPLVLPRAHDCLTLFLGSRARYRSFFEANPGTYVLTSGWIERGEADGELRDLSIQRRLGLDGDYEDWVAQYGEENAAYLRETLGAQGLAHYDGILYIAMGLATDARFERIARERAAERGWRFARAQGDLGLLRRLLDGPWDAEDFLRLGPGQRVRAVVGDVEIVGAEAPPAGGEPAPDEGSGRCEP